LNIRRTNFPLTQVSVVVTNKGNPKLNKKIHALISLMFIGTCIQSR
jgi:hypothetical protein